ncbi:hypothetical protein MTO96_030879 [Rhipicephalus appendiculatus]
MRGLITAALVPGVGPFMRRESTTWQSGGHRGDVFIPIPTVAGVAGWVPLSCVGQETTCAPPSPAPKHFAGRCAGTSGPAVRAHPVAPALN